MSKGTTRAVAYFGAATFVISAVIAAAAGAAMAQGGHACVYVNDDVPYFDGNGSNTVDGYLVTETSQTYLSPVETGGSARGGPAARDIVVNPAGTILYTANAESGDIAAMAIKRGTCELKLLGNFAVGPSLDGIGLAISPDGRWMYASRVSHQKIDFLAVHNDGSLGTIEQEITLTNTPLSMSVTPDGATLIVASTRIRQGNDEAFSYAINPSTGMLTQVSAILTKGEPGGFSIDSEGKFVYVAEPNGELLRVGVFEIGPDSTLTFVRTYNFAQAESAFDALLSANGRYLYLTNPLTAEVTTLAVNDTKGALKYISSAADGTIGNESPRGLATTSNGKFVFTVNIPSSIGILAAGSDGSLVSLGVFGVSTSGIPAWLVATGS